MLTSIRLVWWFATSDHPIVNLLVRQDIGRGASLGQVSCAGM